MGRVRKARAGRWVRTADRKEDSAVVVLAFAWMEMCVCAALPPGRDELMCDGG